MRRALKKRGLAGTVRVAFEYGMAPLAPYSPRKILKRIDDWRYDKKYGVETSHIVDLERLKVPPELAATGTRYQASSRAIFHSALSSLPIRYEDFVFIDFGSGKGKCLLMASDYPFRRILGVEFSAELAAQARTNIARYRSAGQKCTRLESVHADAGNFELPDDPCVCYFYNPFNEALMSKVADNIRASAASSPRPIYVLYYFAAHRGVFDNTPGLQLLKDTGDYCLYESGGTQTVPAENRNQNVPYRS